MQHCQNQLGVFETQQRSDWIWDWSSIVCNDRLRPLYRQKEATG